MNLPVEANDDAPEMHRATSLGDGTTQQLTIPDEVPLEVRAGDAAYATMMVSPTDLEEFVVGFAWTEGLIADTNELLGVAVSHTDDGYVADLELTGPALAALLRQGRRLIPGRTGCGVCGVRTLEDIAQPKPLSEVSPPPSIHTVTKALEAMDLGVSERRGLHAAAWVDGAGQIKMIRDDVGRHNALDKLVGAMLRAPSTRKPGDGFCLITSRCSYEMVQKAVRGGFHTLVAVSAPTTLAVETARACGLRLIALARRDQAFVFVDPDTMSVEGAQ